jgi:hypothetical protein
MIHLKNTSFLLFLALFTGAHTAKATNGDEVANSEMEMEQPLIEEPLSSASSMNSTNLNEEESAVSDQPAISALEQIDPDTFKGMVQEGVWVLKKMYSSMRDMDPITRKRFVNFALNATFGTVVGLAFKNLFSFSNILLSAKERPPGLNMFDALDFEPWTNEQNAEMEQLFARIFIYSLSTLPITLSKILNKEGISGFAQELKKEVQDIGQHLDSWASAAKRMGQTVAKKLGSWGSAVKQKGQDAFQKLSAWGTKNIWPFGNQEMTEALEKDVAAQEVQLPYDVEAVD